MTFSSRQSGGRRTSSRLGLSSHRKRNILHMKNKPFPEMTIEESTFSRDNGADGQDCSGTCTGPPALKLHMFVLPPMDQMERTRTKEVHFALHFDWDIGDYDSDL